MAVGLLTPSTGPDPVCLGPCIMRGVGKGLITLLDSQNHEWLKRQPYSLRAILVKETGCFYVYAYQDGRAYPLHRILLGLGPNDPQQGDHINGHTLDNRCKNLRIATRALNATNQHRRRANSTGFTGVSFHPPSRKYTARIRIDGKRTCLGYFDTPEQAAFAYSKKHEELISKWL